MLKILLGTLLRSPQLAGYFALLLSLCPATILHAQPESMPQADSATDSSATVTVHRSEDNSTDVSLLPLDDSLGVVGDPLGSPYPVPWGWILGTQAEAHQSNDVGLRYYRSPVLLSPDGRYAVYSRVQMKAASELYHSQVVSVIFVEDVETGTLKTITSSSPFSALDNHHGEAFPGMISILVPISWSQDSTRLLSRQFEGIFSTSDATDFAVIWDSETGQVYTVSPENETLTTAILLGWDPENEQAVLFQAGELGEEDWPMWAVAPDGQTLLANTERPLLYGEQVMRLWSGPQSLR